VLIYDMESCIFGSLSLSVYVALVKSSSRRVGYDKCNMFPFPSYLPSLEAMINAISVLVIRGSKVASW
jgi:hypothetical protein